MDYFVSIENTAYFHWQLGILIESFKVHNLEDRLVVAIAENDSPQYASFSKNVVNHKRFFIHPNFGRHLNCCKSVTAAFLNGVIETPFTLIHPDMVLVDPIKPTDHNIIFNQSFNDPEIISRIEADVKTAVEAFGLSREDAPETIPLGDVIVFNQIDIGDLNTIQFRTEQLIGKYGEDWNVSKAGMILALYDLLSRNYRYRADILEGTLLDDNLANFLHYKHGMPPVFSKLHYKYDTPQFMAGGAFPMQSLLENNPTVGTNYLQSIIRAYLE